MLTTRDAYTLTDGPTIFMTNDVKKIGAFYIFLRVMRPVTCV